MLPLASFCGVALNNKKTSGPWQRHGWFGGSRCCHTAGLASQQGVSQSLQDPGAIGAPLAKPYRGMAESSGAGEWRAIHRTRDSNEPSYSHVPKASLVNGGGIRLFRWAMSCPVCPGGLPSESSMTPRHRKRVSPPCLGSGQWSSSCACKPRSARKCSPMSRATRPVLKQDADSDDAKAVEGLPPTDPT